MSDSAKSFADVVASVLEDGWKLTKLLLLVTLLAAIVWFFVWSLLRSIPRGTTQINLGTSGLLVAQTTKQGADYLVVIHPQGWQETGIQVREGDDLDFEAQGSIEIDLEGLVHSVEERQKAEKRVTDREKALGRWDAEKGLFRPERYFTQKEKEDSELLWAWTDPNGNPETKSQASPYRRQQSIRSDYNYGALLGAIRETQAQPTRDEAFFVGRSNSMRAKKSGKLYFTVNDVWDDDDPDFPEKFFVDNVGFFYAKVSVTPPR